MFSEGIFPTGDGLLDIDDKRLNGFLVQDDINEFYDVEQTPFARGKFAAVRRAIHKKTGLNFAAKFLKRRRRAQSSDKEIKHEIAVLMLCSGSDNIVKLNAVHESRFDTALLLELVTGGELQTYLDNEGSLTEEHTRICMREVLKAIQFLHKRSIAHLDLKPQNILLNGERIEDGLKLCDFGISRVVENGSKIREILGTPDYVAPEVLQYEPLCLKTDIWSIGVLAYVLLSGFTPFGGETKQETFLNISQCELTFPDDLFEGISNHALDFIKDTLRIKPNDRLSAAECLEHIWLRDDCTINRPNLNLSSKASYASTAKSTTNGSRQYEDEDISNDEDDEEEDISSCTHRIYKPATTTAISTTTPLTNNSPTMRRLSNDVDSNKENITISSQQPQTTVVTTTVNICIFPDAPTTPKVVRKSSSTDSSPTSVKALVKKFQLECNETNTTTTTTQQSPNSILLKDTQNTSQITTSNGSSTATAKIEVDDHKSTTTSTSATTTYKSSCVFCLSYGGPGCRHSGTSVSNKSSSNTLVSGLDQGIIC